jgi:hypothetical protein
MHQSLDSRGNQWRLALGVSFGVHILLLIVVRHHSWPTHSIEVPSDPIVMWLSDWQPPREIDDLDDQIPERVEADEFQDVPSEPDTISETPTLESTEPSPTSTTTTRDPIQRSIKWEEETRRAIAKMREARDQERNYLTFGFPFEQQEGLSSYAADGGRNSGQESDNLHLPLERSSFGDQIVSYDDGCYLTVGVGSILVEQSFQFTNFSAPAGIKCSRPARVRDDLFADQKPEYLK